MSAFDPTDHGAAWDGKTDDSAAIRASIADAVANGGGVIHFPARPIRCHSNLPITGNNLIFEGEGDATCFHWGGDGGLFLNSDPSQVRRRIAWRDFSFDGMHAAKSGLFEFDNFYKCSVREVYASRFGGVAHHLIGSVGHSTYYNDFYHCPIVSSLPGSSAIVIDGEANQNQWSDCPIQTTAEAGPAVVSNGGAMQRIVGTYFQGEPGAVFIHGAAGTRFRLTNCHFDTGTIVVDEPAGLWIWLGCSYSRSTTVADRSGSAVRVGDLPG